MINSQPGNGRGPCRAALARGGGLMLLLTGLAACQGGSGEQGGEAGSQPTASGMVAAERVANCAGFTSEAAAQFLGVPAGDVKDESADIYDKLRSCSFASSTDDTKRVTFSLRRDDTIEEAADEMAQFREHLGVADKALGGETGAASNAPPYEDIPSLGDEAVWARVNGTLNVREGNVSIQVAFPEDRAEQKRLAALVVAGLR
jgi:hypothetical protein